MAANDGAISPGDRQRIVASATDYIESWIAGDADRMAGCMHPELIKRSVEPDPQTGGTIVRTLTRARMVALTAADEGAEDAGPYQGDHSAGFPEDVVMFSLVRNDLAGTDA